MKYHKALKELRKDKNGNKYSWDIIYKDKDDPLWKLWNDFVDAPIFKTKKEASDYVKTHKDEFEDCLIKIKKVLWT